MPVELLPQLERFSRILLWMDDDLAGREGADRVSDKLGMGRCHIVRPSPGLILPKLPTLPPPAVSADASSGSSAAPAVGGAAAAASSLSAGGDPAVALPKDANEMLQRGLDLRPLVAAAAPRRHDQILDFAELRGAVMREVAASLGVFDSQYGAGRRDAAGNFRSAAGVPYRSLPRLQRLLKGHRPGEVTIVTGPTGSGKTTLLSQLSLDLAAQGVRTLWGSFEIKHARLIAAMLTQLRSGRIPLEGDLAMQMRLALGAQHRLQPGGEGAGSQGAAAVGGRGLPAFASSGVGAAAADDWLASPPPSVAAAHAGAPFFSSATSAERSLLQSYERAADVLGALPLQFLRFYGSSDVDRVVDALEYASYVHDTEHVILDNLQFMMSASGSGRGGGGMFDRFEAQERALDKFRAFATRHDVHLTLVIHPRKEPEDAPLSMSSVFGSAKATQEADTVYILQRAPDGRKYIDVKKNRYDGSVGMVPLAFDPDAKCFSEHEAVVMSGSATGSASGSAPAGAGGTRGGQGAAEGSGSAPGGGDSVSRRRPSGAGVSQSRSFSTSARTPTASASARCCAGEHGFHTVARCHATAAASTGYAKKSPELWRQLYARKAVAAAVAAATPERALLRQRLASELEEDLTHLVLPAFRLHPVHSDAEDAKPVGSITTVVTAGEGLPPNVS
jgi:energy-coupling factor transporter ATP-binding protein EcfA2